MFVRPGKPSCLMQHCAWPMQVIWQSLKAAQRLCRPFWHPAQVARLKQQRHTRSWWHCSVCDCWNVALGLPGWTQWAGGASLPEAQAQGGAGAAASWLIPWHWIWSSSCCILRGVGNLGLGWQGPASRLVLLWQQRHSTGTAASAPAELVPSQPQSRIFDVRICKIIETRLVLTASGPHVNLALMWSLSLKTSELEFCLDVRTVLFITSLLLIVGPSGIGALYNSHRYLRLLAPSSDKWRW